MYDVSREPTRAILLRLYRTAGAHTARRRSHRISHFSAHQVARTTLNRNSNRSLASHHTSTTLRRFTDNLATLATQYGSSHLAPNNMITVHPHKEQRHTHNNDKPAHKRQASSCWRVRSSGSETKTRRHQIMPIAFRTCFGKPAALMSCGAYPPCLSSLAVSPRWFLTSRAVKPAVRNSSAVNPHCAISSVE